MAEVVTDRGEECVRDRDHSLVAALALGDEQRSFRHLHVIEVETEDFATSEPAQHHRVDHRPVPMGAQSSQQGDDLGRAEDLRQCARYPHQRHLRASATTTSGRQSARHRVRRDRCVTAGDQIRVESGDRRQAPGDRARRQPGLAVTDPDDAAVASLVGHEVEDVRRGHVNGVLVDDREERLQIMRDRSQRVRPGPARHESQIGIGQRISQGEPDLPAARRGSDETWELGHADMLQPTSERHGDTRWIIRVLGDRGTSQWSVTAIGLQAT